MKRVSIDNISFQPSEQFGIELFGEASTLGLPPGDWPDVIIVDAYDAFNRPAEFRFCKAGRVIDDEGDLLEMLYESDVQTLRIAND